MLTMTQEGQGARAEVRERFRPVVMPSLEYTDEAARETAHLY